MDLPLAASHPADWVPVEACTLPTSQQPLRATEFDDLFTASLRGVERPPGAATRARLVLAGDETLLDRVQHLVDAENACCSFFSFTVTPLPGDVGDAALTGVVLDIEVPAAHADVLAGLLVLADQALGADA